MCLSSFYAYFLLAVPEPTLIIDTHPVNKGFFIGQQLNLTCTAKLDPTPAVDVEVDVIIDWSHTGLPVNSSDDTHITVTRVQTNPILFISKLSFVGLSRGDIGEYICMTSVVPRQSSLYLQPGHASLGKTIVIESKHCVNFTHTI